MEKLKSKPYIVAGTALVSLLLAFILMGARRAVASGMPDQNAEARWDKKGTSAQISCFVSKGADLTPDSIEGFEHRLDSALVSASITAPAQGASLWKDCYSGQGRATLKTDRASVDAQAVGVGGDFFYFHPVELRTGQYLWGDTLMTDLVLVDEDIAWQLFGSNDIVGQYIDIAGTPHIVQGVFHRPEGRMEEAAGLNMPIVFMSYDSLDRYGTNYGLGCYELLMPNPVSGYALDYVTKNLGVSDTDVEIVENSARFDFLPMMRGLAGFGTEVMNGKAVIYPYWENIARGRSQILRLLLVIELILFIYTAAVAVIMFIRAWRRRSWTVKGLALEAIDRVRNYSYKKGISKQHKHHKEDVYEESGKEPAE